MSMKYIEIFLSGKLKTSLKNKLRFFYFRSKCTLCGSDEYPQCMIWIKIRKIRYIPCKPPPNFCYIKVGFTGVYISWTCFPDALKFGLEDLDEVFRTSRMRLFGNVEGSKEWIVQVCKLEDIRQDNDVLLSDRKKLGMGTADPPNRS